MGTRSQAKCTNLGRLMESHGPRVLGKSYKDPITSFRHFHQFSVQHPEARPFSLLLHFCVKQMHSFIRIKQFFWCVLQIYWQFILNELSVQFTVPPKCILDLSDKTKHGGTWLPGAVLNIADCCLKPSSYQKKHDDSLAVVWRQEGRDDHDVERMTLKELREQVMYGLSHLALLIILSLLNSDAQKFRIKHVFAVYKPCDWFVMTSSCTAYV